MLREEGWVVALDGQYALVSSARRKSCGGCQSKAACGATNALGGQNDVQVLALNTASAKVGDRVILAMHEHLLVRASFLIYILPVFALLFSLGFAQYLVEVMDLRGNDGKVMAFLFGIGAMALTFLGLRRYNTRLEKEGRYRPTIATILLGPWSQCETE